MSEFSTREENNQKTRFKKYIWFQFQCQADIVFRFHFFLYSFMIPSFICPRRLNFSFFLRRYCSQHLASRQLTRLPRTFLSLTKNEVDTNVRRHPRWLIKICLCVKCFTRVIRVIIVRLKRELSQLENVWKVDTNVTCLLTNHKLSSINGRASGHG